MPNTLKVDEPFFQHSIVAVEMPGQWHYMRAPGPESVMPSPVPSHDDSLGLIGELVRCQIDNDTVLLRPRMMFTVAHSIAIEPSYAVAQLGKPYVWGGAGPDVFDCSGLTLRAYQTIGINLPHKSSLQSRYGRSINWRTEPIEAGDLIFHRGSIPVHDNGHVGIAISATQWIVAPKSGDVVSLRPIPFDRVQTVRRLITSSPTA